MIIKISTSYWSFFRLWNAHILHFKCSIWLFKLDWLQLFSVCFGFLLNLCILFYLVCFTKLRFRNRHRHTLITFLLSNLIELVINFVMDNLNVFVIFINSSLFVFFLWQLFWHSGFLFNFGKLLSYFFCFFCLIKLSRLLSVFGNVVCNFFARNNLKVCKYDFGFLV